MELRVLKYFLMIAREENITRAAQRLNVTQPTLSRQLMQMEEELGVKLFKRGKHSISLTEDGILLKQRAQEIINIEEKIREDLSHSDDMLMGTITIGSGETCVLSGVAKLAASFRKENPKVADIMSTLVSEIEQDEVKYKGQSILNIVENMKHECIEKVVMDFSITWYVSKDDVMYAATHYRNGEIPNESAIKSTADFTSFKEAQERAIPKFKYYNMMIEELRKTLEEEIRPLLNN